MNIGSQYSEAATPNSENKTKREMYKLMKLKNIPKTIICMYIYYHMYITFKYNNDRLWLNT